MMMMMIMLTAVMLRLLDCWIIREFYIFALDAAHVISNTAAHDESSSGTRITKPQTPSSGKKYHQPISFSFADIMEKVRASNIDVKNSHNLPFIFNNQKLYSLSNCQ